MIATGAAVATCKIRSRRQAAGLQPITEWNVRVKWLWSAKPQLAAIRARLSVVLSIFIRASWTRRSTNQRCGGTPVLALNECANWLRDKRQALASTSTVQPPSVAASRSSSARRACQGASVFVERTRMADLPPIGAVAFDSTEPKAIRHSLWSASAFRSRNPISRTLRYGRWPEALTP